MLCSYILVANLSSSSPVNDFSLSRKPLSYPVMILSFVNSEPLYLWDVPHGCFWAVPKLSQSLVAPAINSLNHAAGIKFRINIDLHKSFTQIIEADNNTFVFMQFSFESQLAAKDSLSFI